MTPFGFGIHTRMQFSATFDEVLRWQRCASTWHQLAPRPHADDAARFELFDDALLRVPPFIERWRRAIDAPQALAALAQLWLAIALPPDDALPRPLAIDPLVLDAARRLRAQYPPTSPGALPPSEDRTAPQMRAPSQGPSAYNDAALHHWERFYALPIRLQAERVRQRIQTELRWELHALEARQTRRLPMLTRHQHEELSHYNQRPCPLDACLQAVLRRFEAASDTNHDSTQLHTLETTIPADEDTLPSPNAPSTPPTPNEVPAP